MTLTARIEEKDEDPAAALTPQQTYIVLMAVLAKIVLDRGGTIEFTEDELQGKADLVVVCDDGKIAVKAGRHLDA